MPAAEWMKMPFQKSAGNPAFLFAWLISIIFHPLLLFFFMACVFCLTGLVPVKCENPGLILTTLFAAGVLLPLLGIALLRKGGYLKSLSLENRSDRHLPHLFTFLIYLFLSLFLHRFHPVPAMMQAVLQGTAVCIGLVGLITLWWKISSHMAGSGGISGFLLANSIADGQGESLILLGISMVLALVIGASRFYLNAHNGLQLLAGFFLGMVCSSVSMCFFAELF